MQTWRVACYEWFDALRSRRALVVLLLLFGGRRLQHALVDQPVAQTGVRTCHSLAAPGLGTGWRGVHRPLEIQTVSAHDEKDDADDLVLRDITGKHPWN
jgi:hypothetical protein